MPEERYPTSDLERELRELGDRIEYPPTPDLTRSVRDRLGEEYMRPRRLWLSRRGLAAAAVALVMVAAVAMILSPAVRATVFEWLGLKGVVITREEPETGNPLAKGLYLGRRSTLEEARAKANMPILLPDLGKPDGVYVERLPYDPDKYGITFAYRARPGLPAINGTEVGLILSELPGDIRSTYFVKRLPPEARLEKVNVDGERGFWIPGKHHLFSPTGGKERVAQSTLLWERKSRTLRLEADISRKEALKIAGSVR